MSRTKEPWVFKEDELTFRIRGKNGRTVVGISKHYMDDIALTMSDMRRIVACVNACSCISNETLESYTSAFKAYGGNLDECLEKAIQQRDELMAAVGIFIYNRDVQKLFPEHCSAAGGVIEKIKAGVK